VIGFVGEGAGSGRDGKGSESGVSLNQDIKLFKLCMPPLLR
jgi:hypothetical protein